MAYRLARVRSFPFGRSSSGEPDRPSYLGKGPLFRSQVARHPETPHRRDLDRGPYPPGGPQADALGLYALPDQEGLGRCP